MNKKLLVAIQEGREDVFYNSRTWRKKRLDILDRDNNECQLCKSNGGVGSGEVVHHVKYLKKYPSLGMTDSNLLTVCNHCHNTLHPEKQKGYRKRPINQERW